MEGSDLLDRPAKSKNDVKSTKCDRDGHSKEEYSSKISTLNSEGYEKLHSHQKEEKIAKLNKEKPNLSLVVLMVTQTQMGS